MGSVESLLSWSLDSVTHLETAWPRRTDCYKKLTHTVPASATHWGIRTARHAQDMKLSTFGPSKHINILE